MTQECPQCGMVHAEGEPRCDCGYELQWPPPPPPPMVVTWPEIRGLSGRIGRSSFLLRFVLPWAAGYAAFALIDGAIGAWEPAKRFGPLSTVFLALTLYPLITLSVKRLHDCNAPGWLAIILVIPGLNLLALLALCTIPGSPRENRFGPRGVSAFRTGAGARVVSRTASSVTVSVILAHLTFAAFVVPVFANMFDSVNLALVQPTRAIMELSLAGLLLHAYVVLDVLVVLLWFRFSRPRWERFWLELALPYVVITIGSIVVLYLPILDMINAVQ